MMQPASLLVTASGLGASDCEQLRDATLAQPINTITSGAYLAAASVIVVIGRRAESSGRRSAVLGACVAGIGVGSVLFHGPQPPGSRLAHDLPIVLTAIFIAIHEIEIRRDRDRSRRARAGLLVLAAGAVSLWLFGRTDSPLCDPDSILQLHGSWHIATAILLVLWWNGAPKEAGQSGRPRR